MIEKKIGSKLLFVFLTCFASLLFSFLLFPVSSKAANNYDQLVSDLSDHSINISDNNLKNYWESHPDKKVLCAINSSNNGTIVFGDNLVVTQLSPIKYTGADQTNFTVYKSDGGTTQGSFNSTYYPNGTLSGAIYVGFYDGLGNIDFDNPYFSANIPNPNISVSYRNLSSTPVVDVPLNVYVSPFPVGQNINEYYVQMFALVNMDFNYYVQNTRDGIVYNGLDLEKWTTYIDVVNPQDFKFASDLSEDYIHLQLTNGWYDNYPQDSSFNFSFADGIPSPLQSSAISKFHNFRKNATFADNTVYLYVRYFTIDDNNNFIVGPWTVWKSYNPNEFYAELPSYYVPYNVVPASQGTNTNVTPVSTVSPEPSDIYNPVNTNPSVNVTVNQNVPNYPDYPTIASYNKDNLLVDTINSLNSFTQFFGDFGLFLTVAFGFIPEWIWGIIGVGFSLSIIVMFLKIL